MVPSIFKNIGGRNEVEKTVITPSIKEGLKHVTAQYNAEELITKRTEVKMLISEQISKFITFITNNLYIKVLKHPTFVKNDYSKNYVPKNWSRTAHWNSGFKCCHNRVQFFHACKPSPRLLVKVDDPKKMT